MSREATANVTALPPRPTPEWSSGAPPDPDLTRELERSLSLPPTLCALLVARGHPRAEDARRFLRPLLTELVDPTRLVDMEAAGRRVCRALDEGETILVHGDYDVDGISGTALLTRWLRRLGGRVVPFVPDRLRDGYDLAAGGLAAAEEAGAALLLTVDCGIRAHAAVDEARERGIDVVVTDHHAPAPELPAAVAVVNPSRPDCGAGLEVLSGTGVAYKLCQHLGALRGLPEEELHAHLDLVALATIADLVPLTGENRTLVRYGLKALRRTTKPGLRALFAGAGLEPADVDSGRIGFVLAPRINAAGRIGDSKRALRLLLTDDPAEAGSLAEVLEDTNERRRSEDRRILAEALDLLADGYDPEEDYGVVLAGEGWHPGVIGIVASRIVERIHRPVVMVALGGDGGGRGSARSIGGFHLAEALEACGEHLVRFGGHARAAGLDVERARLQGFIRAFQNEARRALEGTPLRPTIRIDLELRLADATDELYRYLEYFGPFGVGNSRPVFLARGVGAAGARVVGSGHLKLTLEHGGARLEAIGFGLAERISPEAVGGGRLDVVFQLRENVYRGRRTLQARLLDLRVPEAAVGAPPGKPS